LLALLTYPTNASLTGPRVETPRVLLGQRKQVTNAALSLSGRPPYMVVDCRRPSISGHRRCSCLERTSAPRHVCTVPVKFSAVVPSFQPYLSRLVVVFVNFQVSLLYTSIAFVTYLYLHTYSTSVETPGPFGTFAPEPVLTILRPGGQLCDVSTEVARDWTTATLSRRAYNTQSPHSRLNVITSASPRASK